MFNQFSKLVTSQINIRTNTINFFKKLQLSSVDFYAQIVQYNYIYYKCKNNFKFMNFEVLVFSSDKIVSVLFIKNKNRTIPPPIVRRLIATLYT